MVGSTFLGYQLLQRPLRVLDQASAISSRELMGNPMTGQQPLSGLDLWTVDQVNHGREYYRMDLGPGGG